MFPCFASAKIADTSPAGLTRRAAKLRGLLAVRERHRPARPRPTAPRAPAR